MDGPTRFIQVTNDNSLVKYASNNSWAAKSNTRPIFRIGNMGAPVSSFLQKFKGLTSDTISFTFEGLEITVMTSFLPNISHESKFVSCKVDNEVLVTNFPQSPQNNWPICSGGNLTDDEHTLTVNIGSPNILFDYILYAPSPTKMLDLTDVSTRIEASDPSVTYSGGLSGTFQEVPGLTRFMDTEGASATVSFVGQRLTWYGAYPAHSPASSSVVEYTIDTGTPTQFLLEATIPSNFTDLLNQPYFQTEVLPQGPHHVTMTYLGGEIPLSLSFVVVQNFSNIASSPTPSSTMTDVPSTTTSLKITSAGSRSNRDMIIGIASGVVIFLLIIILFLLRQWKKRGLKGRKFEKRIDILSNRERAMRSISMVIPNPFNVRDSGQSLLTQHRATEISEGSTEALFNSYVITPFPIPSLPVQADFEEEKITYDNSRPLPLAVHDNHLSNDAASLSLNQHNRPPSNPFISTPYPLADSGSTRAAAEVLETSAAPISRLSSTARPVERHADSGVRLNRGTLLYSETNSEWSLRSKDKLPPLYTHD